MSVKINKFEIENVKRVKAVTMEPTQNGLTIIGGNNNQGKTSVLDAIAWALGGNKYKPDKPKRDGSVVPPSLRFEMSNGLVVERTGVNSALKVIDPQGNKGGQALLDSFVEELALNLPKFMQANNREKANTLLQIIGVGDQIHALEQQEETLYNRRHALGQIADQKKKYAEEQEYYPEAPAEYVSATTLIQEQQTILARNGENQRKRQALEDNKKLLENNEKLQQGIKEQLETLASRLSQLDDENQKLQESIAIGTKSVMELVDESTTEIEKSIEDIEKINVKVRANQQKAAAKAEAEDLAEQYEGLTKEIEDVRKAKRELLEGARLPLPELSVEDGELTYKGYKWDGMSGSEKLKVSTAIVRELKPECGFVLLDKLEQFDHLQLEEFGAWCKQEGLQVIATRVSTGDECSIIIEDGYGDNTVLKWQKGQF
ncbi:MAG: AAA family ATPase [Eubacteriales bacterium]|nr:AAA family ATPase [Eubacteriales bacterium]